MVDEKPAKMEPYKRALDEMREAAPLRSAQDKPIINIDDLKLDDVTDELLIDQFIEMGDELGVDTRQGSIYWDACMGSMIRTSTFIEWLSKIKEIISLESCTGDVLDEKLMERGLSRNPASSTPATYYVELSGEIPDLDSAMTCGGYFFTLQKLGDKYIIVSEDVGEEMNNLVKGTAVIPEIDVDGLVSATLGDIAIPAVNIEDDDSARSRLIRRLSGPDENGNRSQVRTWCESVNGVGSARIIPQWNGPLTVKAVIVSKDGGVPASGVISSVQNYVDPGASGMGEGMATIGQFVTVVAAEAVKIDVSVSVLKKDDATYSGVQDAFRELLKNHFTDMALKDYMSGMAIRYVRVGSLLEGLDDVVDYEHLTLNGKSENVTYSITQIPVLGEVVVDGNIQ